MRRTINNSELKYRIKQYLDKISMHDYSLVLASFPRYLNIEARTFQRYYLTRKGEKYQIPSEHLIWLAKFFSSYFREQIQPEDLINYEIREVTIEELRASGF